MTKNIKTATPADVRTFLTANPDLIPEGSTVGDRGRLSQAVKDVYVAHHPDTEIVKAPTVVQKNVTKTLTYTHIQPSGKKVKKTVDLPVAEIRALAGAKPVGRLSAAAMEKAGEAYAAQAKAQGKVQGKGKPAAKVVKDEPKTVETV